MVLAKVARDIYGLLQVGFIAYEDLVSHLATAGYISAGYTPDLFKHKTRPIQCILVVDNFVIKFTSDDDLQHLLAHLRFKYETTTGKGDLSCGIKLEFYYEKRTVILSMPNYIKDTLIRFLHSKPSKPQQPPHVCAIQYSVK